MIKTQLTATKRKKKQQKRKQTDQVRSLGVFLIVFLTSFRLGIMVSLFLYGNHFHRKANLQYTGSPPSPLPPSSPPPLFIPPLPTPPLHPPSSQYVCCRLVPPPVAPTNVDCACSVEPKTCDCCNSKQEHGKITGD